MDPRFGSPGRIARRKLPFRGAHLLIHEGRPPAASHGAPAPRPPEAIETAEGDPGSQREAGCNLRYTNQPSPYVDKTRSGCIDPAAAHLARLPCGGATEMMQRHSIVSWYSLGCRPWGARHLWPWIRDRPPAGVQLQRVPRRGPCMHMHGRLESFGSPWFDAVTDILAPPRGVLSRGVAHGKPPWRGH